jgi:hypothetical protein
MDAVGLRNTDITYYITDADTGSKAITESGAKLAYQRIKEAYDAYGSASAQNKN